MARCVSPYSTDSNYEGPDTAPRRRPPQRRRQPRHQLGSAAAAGFVASTGDARGAAAGEGQPSPAANSARPKPPPIAAKPRGEFNSWAGIGEGVDVSHI